MSVAGAALGVQPYLQEERAARHQTWRVAEASPVYGGVRNEEELLALWEGGRLPKDALRLTDGRAVRVVYRGRREGGPGPDIREAVVAIEREGLRYGDIECHMRASEWRAHGHHRDPGYDRVILHLVFHDPGSSEAPASTHSGRILPTMALGPWLERRSSELAAYLAGPATREPCHEARERWSEEEVRKRLRNIALRRLRARAERFALALRAGDVSPAFVLQSALFEALGYTRNQEAFRRLAAASPAESLWAIVREREPLASTERVAELFEAVLLARSGLLSVEGAVPGALVRPRERLAAELGERPRMAGGMWRRWGMRPDNRPERRIAGAARLLAGLWTADTIDALRAAALRSAPDLLASLSVGPAPGWGRVALVGRARAVEVAVNAVLPLLLARAERRSERQVLEAVYLSLPAPGEYGRTAGLAHAIAGERPFPLRGAAGQQALLALRDDYCSRGKCGRCPIS